MKKKGIGFPLLRVRTNLTSEIIVTIKQMTLIANNHVSNEQNKS